MDLIILLKTNWDILGLKAPWFSWLASLGLISFPIYYLAKLYKHARMESGAYLSVVDQLESIQKKIDLKANKGLTLKTYDSIKQIFSNAPSLSPAWSSFNSKIVEYRNNDKESCYWATDSADKDFSESSLIEAHLNKNFFISVPTVVTSTGLLFTFLAILVALFDVKINPDTKKFEGISGLIGGLSGKFVSSVAALFSATIFLILEKSIFYRLSNERKKLAVTIDNLFPRLSPTQVLSDIHNDMAEQNKALRLLNSDIPLKLREGFSESLGPKLEHMVQTFDELNRLLIKAEEQKQNTITGQLESLLTNIEQSIVSTLRNMGNSFSDSLSGSVMDQFNKAANSLDAASDLLNGMNKHFLGTQAALNDLISLSKSSMAEQMALGQSQVEALTSVLRGLMTQLKQTTDTSVAEMSSALAAITRELSETVADLGEQMSQTIKKSSDNATDAAQEVIHKAGAWTSKSAEQLDQLAEKYQSQFELTKELNNALKLSLLGFKNSLDKYGQVTGDLKQVASDVNTTVKLMADASSVIKENQESLSMIAVLTKEQINALNGANQDQKELWEDIYNSMQQYKALFQEVENSAKGLLLQISDNLTDYTEQTGEHFQSLVKISNEHFGNAVKGLGQTVGELDELMQNLNDVLSKKN